MMHGDDLPPRGSSGRNPFEDDETTSLSACLAPPERLINSSSSYRKKSMQELRKTRGALIGGHRPSCNQSSANASNEEISVPECQDDVESNPFDTDYASRGPSLISTGSSKNEIRRSTSASSSKGSPLQGLAASMKSKVSSFRSFNVTSINLPSIITPSLTLKTRRSSKVDSLSSMRYGTNLSPHADEYDEKPRRRKLLKYALVALSVALVVSIIVVAVVSFGGDSSQNASNVSSTASAREQALDTILLRISSKTDLADPSAPQYKARQWLLYKDSLWTHPAQAVPGERVIQRYVMAVFYFATGGLSSWSENNWLQGDECKDASGDTTDWIGLACNSYGEVQTIAFGKPDQTQ